MTYLVNKNPPPRASWFDTAASFFLGAASGFFVGVCVLGGWIAARATAETCEARHAGN